MNFNQLVESIRNAPREVGGYFEFRGNRIVFVKTVDARRNVSTGREYVNLPSSEHAFLWHYHPLVAGFWPSFEDLMLSFPNTGKPFPCYVNLILTPYGTWILDGLCKQVLRDNDAQTRTIDALFEVWRGFHDFMTKTTQREGWDNTQVQFAVEAFRYHLFERFGYRLTFVDNGLFRRNLTLRTYVKDVLDYIRYSTSV
jgi:hypothetical protein